MALRGGCRRIGQFVRLAAAALISASALSIAAAPAEAHHYWRHRTYAIAHHPHYHYAYRTTRQAYHATAKSTTDPPGSSGRSGFAGVFRDRRRRQQRADALLGG